MVFSSYNKEFDSLNFLTDKTNVRLASLLENIIPGLIYEIKVTEDTLRIKTSKDCLQKLMLFLCDHSLIKCKTLVDIAVYDKPGKLYRFNINYVLLSTELNTRIIVTVPSNEILWVPTVTTLFKTANWYEREAWDTFGIFFSEHPDLRRILNDYGFSGFPFRKDFPISGFVDIRFQETTKRFKYETVKNFKYRKFKFSNTWNFI